MEFAILEKVCLSLPSEGPRENGSQRIEFSVVLAGDQGMMTRRIEEPTKAAEVPIIIPSSNQLPKDQLKA
jgi:hypothetical protein